MMHRARSSIVEVAYCFSRSSVKFQGHTALKIVEFDPKWAFPDCNSSLNSPMAMKCCTKLETAKERCPIVFQGHPSNFKVTRYKASPILTQIGRFQTIGQSQLSNPSDLPCFSLFFFQVPPPKIQIFSPRPRPSDPCPLFVKSPPIPPPPTPRAPSSPTLLSGQRGNVGGRHPMEDRDSFTVSYRIDSMTADVLLIQGARAFFIITWPHTDI